MKRVLMIAYHFPPLAGSSGIQRTLRFVGDLPQFGWEAMVLTVDRRAYDRTSDDLLSDVPKGTLVRRAFALDTARHLSVGGRYPRWLALPDRWVSWLMGAIPTGLRLIRQYRPNALWSTYPIASAHLVGNALARLTGIPWVADFRDPMAHAGYPSNARVWQSYLKVERRVFSRANRVTFATPGAVRLYSERYPESASRFVVLENGYDELSFTNAETGFVAQPLNAGSITLLHSGIVYPEHRNPEHLFAATRKMLDAGSPDANRVRLRFRAPSHDAFVRVLAARHGLTSRVEVLPAIDYQDALREMLSSDALLLLQSDDCNDQIPAKLYEYIRARRPVLGLTDPRGDTANAMRRAGLTHIAPLDSVNAIEIELSRFLADVAKGASPIATPEGISVYSRRSAARTLSHVLDDVSVGSTGSEASPRSLDARS